MKTLDFTGKVALITGASSGLGVQFAHALADQGADLAIVARRADRLEKLAADIRAKGRRCLPVRADVSDEQSVADAVGAVLAEYGKIDILVNNAGVVEWSATLAEHTGKQWDNVLNVDLKGVFLFSREVSKSMIEKKYGRIVNIASIAGLVGGTNSISYYAAKGGVVNLTRALSAELAPYGITVNAIGPGVFESEMTADLMEGDTVKKLSEKNPMGRIGRSGELDGAVLYFASDMASYTTGQTIYIDGGGTSVL